MFKERKSGFLNQGSFGWGIGVGIAMGAVGYLLYRRPHRVASPKESFHPPINSSIQVTDSTDLAKDPQEAAGGPAEAEVG